MKTIAVLSFSFLAFLLSACGDNIRPSEADVDGDCLEGDCPADVDAPDAGAPEPDAGAPTPDAGGETDAGTGTNDGGANGDCGGCPVGQSCVDGTCVCDQDGDVPDADCGPDEVRLCHAPPGDPDARHAICVGANAVAAHQAHGDALGDCP